ncbi:hypothetical protein [Aureibaculum conchae]|uniref:hypothetical protein n=1 Tax=Aureibaculum sp. 2308TA14-22 TaxID=3108392 RepID=UPI0033982E57
MNKFFLKTILLFVASLFISCSPTKKVLKDNYVFQYVDNQDSGPIDITKPRPQDEYRVYKVLKTIKTKIGDKTDYLIIKNKDILKSENSVLIKTVKVVKSEAKKIALNNAIYTSESSITDFSEYQESFKYSQFQVALQTLSIPLKFRKRVDNGSMIPNQVETGVNIGLAPVAKLSLNVFNPSEKTMGKNTNQYSINGGLLLNLGATDLKAASSAPGISVDRKAATFTYGTFIMVGVNNFNLGYAIGWDNAIGNDSSKWVYQNKLWHGLVIALDIIK